MQAEARTRTGPRRFCFILPHIHFEFSGGAETQCYFLARELLRRGWEVHYIRESDAPAPMCVEGIQVHAIPRRRKLFKWRNSAALGRAMRAIRADAWYVRSNPSYLPLVIAHARALGGTTLWAFSRDSQLRYDNKCIEGRGAHNAVARFDQWRFFRALRRVDRILLQTEDQKKALERTRKLGGEVIYNAHPLPAQQEPGDHARENLVVWIGRLQEFKHPERFVELARRLKASPLSFRLAGDSEDPRRFAELESAARALPNLRLLGQLSPAEVHTLLGTARVLVNTSDYEGFSNTFIEAWARGVPVVSLHVDPDRLIETKGLGVVAGNLATAAEAVQRLTSDARHWRILSENCLEFAYARFDIADAVDRLETVLEPAP